MTPEHPTRPIAAGPDAPTARLRWLAGAVRGALADTKPLRTPAYRRLWVAGTVTVIGSQLSVVAVPTQIYALTGSSAWVGLTGLFGLVPLVVFGLWGGAIADAVDRRVLLLVTGAGIAASSLALWVTAASGVANVWVILTLFAVQTAFLSINQPTRSAVIPRLLPAAELPAANALNMTVMQFGAIVGPLLAGVLSPSLACRRSTSSTRWPSPRRSGRRGGCPPSRPGPGRSASAGQAQRPQKRPVRPQCRRCCSSRSSWIS